jgi:hypothetical protein
MEVSDQLQAPAALSWGKSSQYSLNRRQCETQIRSGCGGKEEYPSPIRTAINKITSTCSQKHNLKTATPSESHIVTYSHALATVRSPWNEIYNSNRSQEENKEKIKSLDHDIRILEAGGSCFGT